MLQNSWAPGRYGLIHLKKILQTQAYGWCHTIQQIVYPWCIHANFYTGWSIAVNRVSEINSSFGLLTGQLSFVTISDLLNLSISGRRGLPASRPLRRLLSSASRPPRIRFFDESGSEGLLTDRKDSIKANQAAPSIIKDFVGDLLL